MFWTEPPSHIRVYPCPECHETISLYAPSCRFCNLPVDVNLATQLWVKNQQVATAITRANTFKSVSNVWATVVTGMALVLLYFHGHLHEFWFISPLLGLSYGAQWLNHNSSLIKDDPDYLAATRQVKTAMLIWTAALLMQVAAYLILNGLPEWNTIVDLFVVE